MKRIPHRRPAPGLIVAIVAVVLAGTGSAVAAKQITGKQIKNGTIQLADLNKSARSKLAGSPGPAGAPGPIGARGPAGATGATGPSNGYFAETTRGPVRLTLGPGKYIIVASLYGWTASETGFVCQLTAGALSRSTAESGTSGSVTMQLAATFTTSTAVAAVCDTTLGAQLSAIRVGSLD